MAYSEVSRRKGLYLRCICGIRKALIQQKRITLLTLTTSDSTGDGLSTEEKMQLVGRSWNILRRYMELPKKRGGLGYGKFEFISVITNEGNGVIHILISGLPFIYWKKIARIWNNIHGSQVVSLAKFKGSAEKMSSYLMSQYLSNQKTVFRFKMSNNWICKEFTKYWRSIKNVSRDYTQKPVWFGRWVYPIDKEYLKRNFVIWISRYCATGERFDYI